MGKLPTHTGRHVRQEFAKAGCQPLSLRLEMEYAAKHFHDGVCPDCGATISVTLRMLRAGNRRCKCKAHSLWGLDPRTIRASDIAKRYRLLNVTKVAEAKAFDSGFWRLLSQDKERLQSVIEFSGLQVTNRRQISNFTKDDCLSTLGATPNRTAINRQQGRVLLRFYELGGTDEELTRAHPHLRPRKRTLNPSERDYRAWWKYLLMRVRRNPKYSLHQLQRDLPGTRGLYDANTPRGIPVVLLFSNAIRYWLRIKPNIKLPSKWFEASETPTEMYLRFAMSARHARKCLRTSDPTVSITAKHLDSKDGHIHLAKRLHELVRNICRDQKLVAVLLADTPEVMVDSLSSTAVVERVHEVVCMKVGFPKTALDHGARETSLHEVVGRCRRRGYQTFNAFRDGEWGFYQWLRNSGNIEAFKREMRWINGTYAYFAVHAHQFVRSEFEAIVANIFAISGTVVLYDEPYPNQDARSFRYDFYVVHKEVYVEVWAFAPAGTVNGARADKYRGNREEKLWAADQLRLSVISIETERFYVMSGSRLNFAEYAYMKLKEADVLSRPLSKDELAKATDVHQVGIDPIQAECELRQALERAGVPEADSKRTVDIILEGVRSGDLKLTKQETFKETPGWDPRVVFRCISRTRNMFVLRRMVGRKVQRVVYSDAKHGGPAAALVTALCGREQDPFYR